jgi:hypothetical protein
VRLSTGFLSALGSEEDFPGPARGRISEQFRNWKRLSRFLLSRSTAAPSSIFSMLASPPWETTKEEKNYFMESRLIRQMSVVN